MWVPRTASDVERAILDGTLPHESAQYEYKQMLPPSAAKNVDIAVDVCAMTVRGGVIIYGISEDKAAATFGVAPVALAGLHERISSVVEANVVERPEIDVHLLPLAEDASRGYVVVDIPASLRAPHMVEVKGEYRYYGRHPGGNRLLTEAEVADLYGRRRQAEEAAGRAIDQAIELAPAPRMEMRGDLHLVARPLLGDGQLRSRALPGDNPDDLRQLVMETQSLDFAKPWSPDFLDAVRQAQPIKTLTGVGQQATPHGPERTPYEYWTRLEFCDDGTLRYFQGGIARLHGPVDPGGPQTFMLREPAIPQIVARFCLMEGRLLQAADYRGPVEVGIAVTDAGQAPSAEWLEARWARPFGPLRTLETDDYRHSIRTSAATLYARPQDVARSLTEPIARVVRTGDGDPLAPRST